MEDDHSLDYTPPPTYTEAKHDVEALSCPSCGGAIKITAVGHSITAICPHCSSTLDVTNPVFQLIEQANEKARDTLIPMGTRGMLDNIAWEVIGYMERQDHEHNHWDEYLLFNPYYGFRFLVEERGDWFLYKVIKEYIDGAGTANHLVLDNRGYERDYHSKAYVSYVKGEFYWRVKKFETVDVMEYIDSSHLLSVESNEQEVTVSSGKAMDSKTIKDAFAITCDMPASTAKNPYFEEGTSNAYEDSPYDGRLQGIWLTALAMAFIAAAVHFIYLSLPTHNQLIHSTRFEISATDPSAAYATNNFTLTGGYSSIEISSQLVQSSSWMTINGILSNITNHKVYYFRQYLGNESGMNKRNAVSDFSSLPAGEYAVSLTLSGGVLQSNQPSEFNLYIHKDVESLGRYFFVLFLILLYPLYATYRHLTFRVAGYMDQYSGAKQASTAFWVIFIFIIMILLHFID